MAGLLPLAEPRILPLAFGQRQHSLAPFVFEALVLLL